MQVDLTAKLKDFAAFAQQYVPGDQTRLFYGKPLIFSALANSRPEPRYEISRFLLDRGAVVAGSNSEGDRALSILLSRKWQNTAQTTEVVKDLIAAGDEPVLRDDRGVTPTQWIAQLPQVDAELSELSELLDFWFALPGLPPAAPNRFGKSAVELTGPFPQREDRVRRMKKYRA